MGLLSDKNGVYEINSKVFLNKIYLRNNESDPLIFEQIFSEQQYNFFHPKPEEVKWIIDAGANVGLSAIFFSLKFPNARIISIEPNKANFEMLLKNTVNYKNVECLNAALWYKEEHLDISNKDEKSASFMVEPGEDKSGDLIKGVTLNQLMEDYKIDILSLVKIDIEGAEKEVFQYNTSPWLSKSECVIVELHDWLKEGTSQVFFKTMSEFNWRTYIKGENIICFKSGVFPDHIKF